MIFQLIQKIGAAIKNLVHRVMSLFIGTEKKVETIQPEPVDESEKVSMDVEVPLDKNSEPIKITLSTSTDNVKKIFRSSSVRTRLWTKLRGKIMKKKDEKHETMISRIAKCINVKRIRLT